MVSPSAHRRQKHKRQVRFAPEQELCDYQEGPKELTLERICELWFQPEEFDEFREDARHASISAAKQGLAAYVKKTYGHTDEKTQDMLNMWTCLAETRRGLERFINETYCKNRLFVRQKTVEAVIYTQERLRKENQYEYERSSEVIRNVAIILSYDAIEFAVMMGKADEKAAASRVSLMRRKSVGRPPLIERKRSIRPRSPNPSTPEDSDSCCSTFPVERSGGGRKVRHPRRFASVQTTTQGGREIRIVK